MVLAKLSIPLDRARRVPTSWFSSSTACSLFFITSHGTSGTLKKLPLCNAHYNAQAQNHCNLVGVMHSTSDGKTFVGDDNGDLTRSINDHEKIFIRKIELDKNDELERMSRFCIDTFYNKDRDAEESSFSR